MKKRAHLERDKTPRKETQAWQARLFQIVEQAGDIIFIANREGIIEYVNPAFEAVTGYAQEEALGKTPRLLKSGMMPQDYYPQLWETILAGEIFRAEVIDRKKNGELFYYEQTISPLKDSQGKVTHFVSTGKDVSERKRAEQEIQLLFRLTQIIAEAEDLDSALVVSLRALCEDAGWDYGEVWTLSNDGARLEPGSPYYCKTSDLESFCSKSKAFTFAPGIGLPGRVWSSAKAAWIPDVTLDTNFPRAAIAKESGLKAAVGIPILDGDTVVAVIAFFLREARQEDERMVSLISAVAAQLGTVLQRKRAQDEIAKLNDDLERSAGVIEKRLQESDALAQIARSLSETERIGLQTVLQLIAVSAKELIPASEQVVIHLWDEEQQILTAQAVIGFDDAASGQLKMRPNEGVAGHVIASGETISIADVAKDRRFISQGASPKFRSLLVAPIQSGERKLGTISAGSGLVGVFGEDDSRLLNMLGTQAALAIENARLLEATQQGLKEVNALYRVTQGLAATLDAGQIMKGAVDLLQQNFGYLHAQVYMLHPETGDLVLQRGSGPIGEQLRRRGHRLKAGAGIVGHVAETGEPFVTNNVNEVVFFIRNPLLPDTQSELAVPIKVDQRVVGVLDVQNHPLSRLSERDLQLVSAVADHLAVALQKAALYEHLQASLAQEKAIRTQLVQSERLALVGRLLASISHELNNPLQAIQNALFLLKEERGISAQGKQDLQIVLSEVERMAAMIERLRASYRPTYREDFQAVQLNTIVEDVHALMATHLRHHQITFEYHPHPELPPVLGLLDQLRQVVLNLMLNAAEAMPSGGRLIVATELRDEEVRLCVSDTGPGIAPDILPHVFDAFVTDKVNGTGLGLTITYDIVQRHNGHIRAENAPGGGAIFTLGLPAYKKEPS